MELLAKYKSFDGMQYIYNHHAATTDCIMRFGLYLPPQAQVAKVPVLYWLSGLTCTEENFIIKAGAQRIAAELGLALVTPDTSPRGDNIPDDKGSYDLGLSAGFYVDAIKEPWAKHYKMYSYVSQELPALITEQFPIDKNRAGIFGHSMGGHGALVIALRNQDDFKSVSAFAPICSPMQCPWGKKAFTAYLGTDESKWGDYDASHLVEAFGWHGSEILVDQGTDDQFLIEQLKPQLLINACEKANVKLNLRMQTDYDHSYFFIASFIEDHLRFHAQCLM